MNKKFELLREAVGCYKANHVNGDINEKTLLEFIDELEQLTIPVVGCSYFTSSDIGSKFEIVKNASDHGFEIGETVVLDCVSLAEDDEYKFIGEKDYWWCGFTDVKKL